MADIKTVERLTIIRGAGFRCDTVAAYRGDSLVFDGRGDEYVAWLESELGVPAEVRFEDAPALHCLAMGLSYCFPASLAGHRVAMAAAVDDWIEGERGDMASLLMSLRAWRFTRGELELLARYGVPVAGLALRDGE